MPNRSNPPAGPRSRAIVAILHERMKARGISQAEAGEGIGVSQQQMSRYVRGERALNVDEIQALCDLLGLDFHELMRDAQDRL